MRFFSSGILALFIISWSPFFILARDFHKYSLTRYIHKDDLDELKRSEQAMAEREARLWHEMRLLDARDASFQDFIDNQRAPAPNYCDDTPPAKRFEPVSQSFFKQYQQHRDEHGLCFSDNRPWFTNWNLQFDRMSAHDFQEYFAQYECTTNSPYPHSAIFGQVPFYKYPGFRNFLKRCDSYEQFINYINQELANNPDLAKKLSAIKIPLTKDEIKKTFY